MASRSPSPGRYAWLEWGPTEPGQGGGSRVRDVDDAPVRTGSRVADTRFSQKVGRVTSLQERDLVRVQWTFDDPGGIGTAIDPGLLRVIL